MAWFHWLKGDDQPLVDEATTALDMVMLGASLISRPQEVETTLDEVRKITSNLNSSQNLDIRNELALCRVYLDLERYLVTKEPLRTFTKEGLRKHVSPVLQKRLIQLETGESRTPAATHSSR